jgi:threonine aldolase
LAQGENVADLVCRCDSIMFCLSKGLSAPVGSMLVGSRELIDKARSVRKMLGGGMRQAGILAAAGLVALETMPARLIEDHQNARELANLLAELPELDLEPAKVCTNILMVGILRTGLNSEQLAALLKENGVLVSLLDSTRIRLVTHKDMSREQVHQAAEIIKTVLKEQSR